MFPQIAGRLRAFPAITAIVDNRIFRHDVAPENSTRPYITWFVVADVPTNNLSNLPRTDLWVLQVDCWHQTDAGVENLAMLVRDALEPIAHLTGMPVNGRERETKLYRIALQFDYWLARPQVAA